MSHDRAIRNLAETVVYSEACGCTDPDCRKLGEERIDRLAELIGNTVECFLSDIEQEDREAEQKRADRDEALAEEAGEARDERLWVERKATNG